MNIETSEPRLRRAEDKSTSIFQKDSTQVGLMAGVVTMVSQPFAQSRMQELLGLAVWVPVVIAVAVSVLLAAYHVFAIQRVKVMEGVILMPLVAMILFSSYAGTNQLFASDPQQTASAADKTAAARMLNLEEQLNLQREINTQLIKALGLPPEENMQGRIPEAPPMRSGLRGVLERVVDFLIAPAYGQAGKPANMQDEQRRQLEAQLRNARAQQGKLELERRRLEQASSNNANRKAPLLKSW